MSDQMDEANEEASQESSDPRRNLKSVMTGLLTAVRKRAQSPRESCSACESESHDVATGQHRCECACHDARAMLGIDEPGTRRFEEDVRVAHSLADEEVAREEDRLPDPPVDEMHAHDEAPPYGPPPAPGSALANARPEPESVPADDSIDEGK